ncbi:MAG: YggS family pyridoxal phosphate-dependent enzyme [Nitriliruptorales bacterium]|nr:YggS family pyridoxal phosphate-dependent enzyme [Nitriliruptorales bacterium]
MASPASAPDIAGRLEAVCDRVASAARRAGRSPASVAVVAVSKGFPAEAVTVAQGAGQVDFAENRVQELRKKAPQVHGVRWHFVGRLQRNKVRDVVGLVSLVHSVDRIELARDIAARACDADRVQRVLVQVNAGDDPAKAGCTLDEAPALVRAVRDMQGLACEGLMTIPQLGVDPRPTFARLRHLRDDLRSDFPEVQHLSMGMSNDFEVAVEEGATIVRIGEAIFGPRPDPDLQPPAGGSFDRSSALPAGRT